MNACDRCDLEPLGFPVEGLCHKCEAEARAAADREEAEDQRRNLAIVNYLMDHALPTPRTPQPDCATRKRPGHILGARRCGH